MAFKKYVNLDAASWAAIEEASFFNGNSQREKLTVKNPGKPINFVSIERYGTGRMHRNYCRCGYVSNDQDEKKCPICGNENYATLGVNKDFRYELEVRAERKIELNASNNVELSTKRLVITDDGMKYDFAIVPFQVEYEITETNINSIKGSRHSSNMSDFNYDEVMKIYPYDLTHLDLFLVNMGSNFSHLQSYLEAKNLYTNLINSLPEDPKAISIACCTPFAKMNKTTTLEELFLEGYGCPSKEYIPYMKKLLKDLSVTAFNSWRCRNINIFENYDTFTNDLKDSINYLIGHSDFNGVQLRDLIQTIARNAYSEEMQDILARFILANHISEGPSVVGTFDSHVRYLRNNGIEVSAEALDKKNYNSIRNLNYIAEHGKYNQVRAKMFLDAFDVDPMSSLKYLDVIRNPSKKEKQAVEEAINKKYS